MRPALVAGAIVALVLATACGSAPASTSLSGGASLFVLSDSAVPGLPSKTTSLTSDELSKDAAIPGLAGKLAAWGYVQGAERTFQGESRHLSFVVSRALAFKDATGALAYVTFVHDNAGAFFGIAGVAPLDAQGRPGWQFAPSPCACHMASPVVIGIVSGGPDVAWLEINGPDATPSLLVSLLDPSNSVPA